MLRALPSIDALLKTTTGEALGTNLGAAHATALAREVTDELRQEILSQAIKAGAISPETLISEAEKRLKDAHQQEAARRLRRVINATGVILHTNLGRAPLSEAARRAMSDEAARYCTLEYDLKTGSRGRRGGRAEDLVARLTGTEAALVVNNCAAAALLALTVFARDGEAIVSRGELVEIGGDFRVPEVMAQSGTRMIEVGTTNRTKLADYQQAISNQTRLILRVHTSNYRIVGFTKTPPLNELASLAHENGLLLYEDAGSGALTDFNERGIKGEPVIRESFEAGADVISFSGDKLLGGPQAGVLVGRAELIERMRTHALYRSLRADKFRIAALEATLDSYARNAAAVEIPTYRMLALSLEETRQRAREFLARIRSQSQSEQLDLDIIEGESAIGGGAAPTSHLQTALVSIRHARRTASQIEELLRHSDPPVIARIEEGRVLLDLRTVSTDEELELVQSVLSLD